MRYFLDISYEGTRYHGWQIQKNANSIQGIIEDSLKKIFSTKTQITGSGRTDAGVHAIQQIAHFDYANSLDTAKLCFRLNSILPKDISVNSCTAVTDSAHARFDAKAREYEYFMHVQKNPFKVDRSYYFKPDLDIERIQEACGILKKWHDFESFSKVKTEVNNFNCEIYSAIWEQSEDGFVFSISANRFLRGMVRAIVGTFIDIGLKKLSLQEFESVLRVKDRSAAGRSVPAEGLYLTKVTYPESIYKQ